MRLFTRFGFTPHAATRLMVILCGSLLVALALASTASGQTNDTAAANSCVSAEMVRLIAREGNDVRVSPEDELAPQKSGSRENEKGIAFAKAPENARTLQEAHRWFEKAARMGYAPAQVNLAVVSLAGWGTPPNAGTALYWLREAARQGFALAHFDLGILYLNGCGVRQDYGEAFHEFEQGANAGDPAAQMNLGYLYDQGLGVGQDRGRAADWYRKAAEAGLAQAENNLADLYLRGEGVSHDEGAAFAWFQKAARQGHTGARIMLGSMYAEGRGTQKNVQAAYEWICAAGVQGDARGSAAIKELEHQLTIEQLAESRMRVQLLVQSSKHRPDREIALLH